MNTFIAELTGSALLITFGNGVVANVVLNKSKGQNGGWIVVAFGWAMAVFIAVYAAGKFSGAHLNPAVSIALAVAGKFSWAQLPYYLAAQLMGCMLGAFIVWVVYRDHFDETGDAGSIQACFCTAPAISNVRQNFIPESLATLIFMLGVMFLTPSESGMGSLDALPVALLVLGIGLSLGGPTGYAINPARDLGPRIAHFLLPIKHKGNSDWSYAIVPILGPILGSALAATAYHFLHLP